MPKTKKNYEVIVIGGGVMGLSAAYHLGKKKTDTLVLEQFRFINQLGSSAGVSRQFRIPYPESYMVQFVLDSESYWDELQSHTPVKLLDKVGTLWFGDPAVKSTEGNISQAEKHCNSSMYLILRLLLRKLKNNITSKTYPKLTRVYFKPMERALIYERP